jgi:ABC-type polysaccharide/polyol phosphate transport system ATPase subunit
MMTRLAFAIATCKKPDILIIDEGIGAGDSKFFEKANKRLEQFMSAATILIMASHSTSLLEKFCNKCLYMHHGKAQYFGDLETGLSMYNNSLNS